MTTTAATLCHPALRRPLLYAPLSTDIPFDYSPYPPSAPLPPHHPARSRRAIFGYNAQPCFIDVFFYLFYWLVVLSMGLYKWHAGTLSDADYKYKRMMRKQMEEVSNEGRGDRGREGHGNRPRERRAAGSCW